MSGCVYIQMKRGHVGKIYLKTSFEEEFQVVDLNRKTKNTGVNEVEPTFPPNNKPVPISALKYNDLISLLPFIPTRFHAFYKDFPKTNADNPDYPASDNDSDLSDD
ncbi:hypothetical protein J6590_075308 [Homalodisca vitripennis]|nr:hypothetical protein J6590_075308 [Homalodisca vitripennis]